MLNCLCSGEFVVEDRLYKHFICIEPDDVQSDNQIIHVRILALHKTWNEQFEKLGFACQDFRHNVNLHGVEFHAILSIVAFGILHNEPFFVFWNTSITVFWFRVLNRNV